MKHIPRVLLLIACCAAAVAAWTAWTLYSETKEHLARWTQSEAVVLGMPDETLLEVEVPGDGRVRVLQVPRRRGSKYATFSKVRVMGDPDRPSVHRLTGFLDLWEDALVAAVVAIGMFLVAAMLATFRWGGFEEWSGGGWVRQREWKAPEPAASRLLLHEPRHWWKLRLGGGFLIALVAGMAMIAGIPPLARAAVVPLGVGAALWCWLAAVEGYSRVFAVDPSGISETSVARSRRLPWSAVAGLAAIGMEGNRQLSGASSLANAAVKAHSVRDAKGKEVLRLHSELIPPSNLREALEDIRRRLRSRDGA